MDFGVLLYGLSVVIYCLAWTAGCFYLADISSIMPKFGRASYLVFMGCGIMSWLLMLILFETPTQFYWIPRIFGLPLLVLSAFSLWHLKTRNTNKRKSAKRMYVYYSIFFGTGILMIMLQFWFRHIY